MECTKWLLKLIPTLSSKLTEDFQMDIQAIADARMITPKLFLSAHPTIRAATVSEGRT